jgi:CheY-like chemotaxis protein
MPTVLVVEDEELLLDAIKRKLEVEHITPVCFPSGKDALNYLLQAQELPQAIWLDYYLKDMNGMEFMEELNKNPKLSLIPVVVVSNSASMPKVEKMLALGIKKYVLKAEHRLDDIIDVVKQYINEQPLPKNSV